MSEHGTSMEFTGATVEEAIQKGLMSLGVSSAEAVIEIVDEGSKGIFGLGSKEAVVRITTAPSPEVHETATEQALGDPETDRFEQQIEDDDEPDFEEAFDEDDDDEEDAFDEEEDEVVAVTRETVIELLQKMHVAADVRASISPKDDFSNRSAVEIDITGDDLSILIGRKAETLDALQYITRLIVGKELNRSVIINLDVQGYKKRKEQRLRRIAQSVARQAVETGRRQYLEPMSPWDRRIVHMELRNHKDVYTESVGEGNRRKVTVNPKT